MPFGTPQDPYAGYRAGFVDLPQQAASPMAQAVQKPKINWLGVLADALSGAAGQAPLYTLGLQRQRQQQDEEDRYQRHHSQDLQDAIARYQYEIDHPRPEGPTNYERELLAGGYQPGSPEYQSRLKAHLDAQDDPIVTVQLPGDRIYSGPRSGLAAALSGGGQEPKPVGKLTPLGAGGPASGPGNFR